MIKKMFKSKYQFTFVVLFLIISLVQTQFMSPKATYVARSKNNQCKFLFNSNLQTLQNKFLACEINFNISTQNYSKRSIQISQCLQKCCGKNMQEKVININECIYEDKYREFSLIWIFEFFCMTFLVIFLFMMVLKRVQCLNQKLYQSQIQVLQPFQKQKITISVNQIYWINPKKFEKTHNFQNKESSNNSTETDSNKINQICNLCFLQMDSSQIKLILKKNWLHRNCFSKQFLMNERSLLCPNEFNLLIVFCNKCKESYMIIKLKQLASQRQIYLNAQCSECDQKHFQVINIFNDLKTESYDEILGP